MGVVTNYLLSWLPIIRAILNHLIIKKNMKATIKDVSTHSDLKAIIEAHAEAAFSDSSQVLAAL